MQKIASFQEVNERIAMIRNQRKGFVTNFYPDEFKVGLWIKHEQISVLGNEEALLFIIANDDFASLYYAATSLETLQPLLEVLPSQCYVLDYISRGVDVIMDDFMERNGMKKYSALYRMSRITPSENQNYSCDSHLRNALTDDIQTMLAFFNQYFDKYVEQIPNEEELAAWIELGHIIVYEENTKIAGFLIYDQAPASWYLRYWFVAPEYREQKVGSMLIKEGMQRGSTARRQMFWVIETNENAIKRYEHYGYKREQMCDTIYMKINK